MTITFNTNVSALTTQRYLGIASSKASSSLAKLSSGSRVPSAKDDAAALAIGTQLKAEVSALGQASQNAGQATSLLQIADGALSTTSDILNRLKTLAVQASSGQLDDSSRALLNQEFTSLQSEVDRIAGSTNFNGNVLLNGGDKVATTTETQAGYLEGKGINEVVDASKIATNGNVFRTSYDATAKALTITDATTGQSQTVATGVTTALTAGATKQLNFDALGIQVNLNSQFDPTTSLNTAPAADVSALKNTAGSAPAITGTVATSYGSGTLSPADLTAAATNIDSTTGKLSINVTSTGAGTVNIAATTGLEFSKDGVTFASTLTGAVADGSTKSAIYVRATGETNSFATIDLSGATAVAGTAGGKLTLDLSGSSSVAATATAAKTLSFKVGTGTTANDNISFTLASATTTALGINSDSISTAAAANIAITDVSAAITTVASQRASIGASESRLGFASDSVNVAIQNTTAAESGLLDVDVSSEITQFSSEQVLLQAGVSLEAQANQQPSLLLKLLG